ncbi:hypothetical protein I3760_13G132900 [Carya illinoinensis]|nr:hypothetical protein I3760_13G132900 [Carya illinoinensis]
MSKHVVFKKFLKRVAFHNIYAYIYIEHHVALSNVHDFVWHESRFKSIFYYMIRCNLGWMEHNRIAWLGHNRTCMELCLGISNEIGMRSDVIWSCSLLQLII